MSPKRVLLHVGTPKTGTSYLQDVLFRNRGGLAKQGVLYPADRFDAHFLAALDLMRLPWGGLETEAVGAWDRLAEQVRDWSGTAIISHEILATASRPQVKRALKSLGHPDTEIHVVLSTRDLVRQVPAEWQENVKHRRTIKYHRFLEQIQDPQRVDRIATWFWGVQEIPDILDRWGSALDPSRVHVVTVPKPGAPPDLLWQRFARAFDLDGLDLDLHAERANPSMGVPETALIRRINAATNAELKPAAYRPLVRELLAHQTLSRRTRSPRLGMPPEARQWADDLSQAWVAELRLRGYDVIGDLDDLLPDTHAVEFRDPDRARPRQVNAAAIDAIKALLLEGDRMRRSEEELRVELRETRIALERAHLRPTYRMREKIVRSAEAKGWGRRLLGLYRRARGRSS
ncbi:hypothetical protein ncot_00520 [Nocardioides sp. JQ2195]|uniref:hypothetical protein n=1 Tax=Nocardioides sp. JQ2195 TaxID=2592334 RepID=UPI00143EBCB6|nr:hypothetical protein [Nocardioides sp. JQ2195]QIX25235.1 hypothetical protein ncot_00520 [Nocardioides sp. JQ2195]